MSHKHAHEQKAQETQATPETTEQSQENTTVSDASANTHDLVPRQQYNDLVEQLQRLQAEFENFRKRVERDQVEHKLAANDKLLRELLPIADSLDLSLMHAKDSNGAVKGEELLTGLVMVNAQFQQLLEHHGLVPIESDMFDPRKHEALTIVSQEGAQRGAIVQTFQRGYTRGERVFRPAKVSVAK